MRLVAAMVLVPISSVEQSPAFMGSRGHDVGLCRPCSFAHNPRMPCRNGSNCCFCHLEHPMKIRARPCKRKRLRLKARCPTTNQSEESRGDCFVLTMQHCFLHFARCSGRRRASSCPAPTSEAVDHERSIHIYHFRPTPVLRH
mmetsp:Transcript_38341/g.80942  ORF Transcript_38341/g.80942 Transcript_38341/m.80942 type:complete len:143 (-) Transcript_38341:173-601(-)